MSGNNYHLETKNLEIGYASRNSKPLIAETISIQIKKGKLTALVGANGVGKSTLLKTIAGLLPTINGAILINNKPLTSYKPIDLAQEMSLVLTDKLPPSNLSIYEIVALGRQPYTNWLSVLAPQDKIKIDEAIAITGIEGICHKKHYEVSDGQLQIALIARALAQDTDFIILDEPTTHLDLVHKANLLKLLQKLTAEWKKTILFSTHDIDLAIQMCDEMLVCTPNAVLQNEPCNFIASGLFNELFASEHLTFDAKIGKFNII